MNARDKAIEILKDPNASADAKQLAEMILREPEVRFVPAQNPAIPPSAPYIPPPQKYSPYNPYNPPPLPFDPIRWTCLS